MKQLCRTGYRKLRKYAVIARVSLSNAVTYRAALLSRFCFYTLFIYVFFGLWGAIYQEGSVHGYTRVQTVWYLIMTELIAFACGREVLGAMNDDVKTGGIAYHIGRPTHYILYHLANSVGQALLNFVAFGALATALGLILVGPLPTFQLAGLPPLVLSIALSFLLNYFMLVLIGLSAFVIEDNFALFLIYQKLNFMLGMFLPVEFLPEWMQGIAKSLPFSYIHWAPAKLFVDYSPALFVELLPRQALWAGLAAALALGSYRTCVRRLQINGG